MGIEKDPQPKPRSTRPWFWRPFHPFTIAVVVFVATVGLVALTVLAGIIRGHA